MKLCLRIISQVLKAFFFTFGILMFIFYCQSFLAMYGVHNIYSLDIRLCLIVAIILTFSHIIITLDILDNRLSMRIRLIIGYIPAAVACALLANGCGIAGDIRIWFDIEERSSAIASYYIGLVLIFLLFALVFFVVERRFYRIGKQYDEALEAYKARSSTGN